MRLKSKPDSEQKSHDELLNIDQGVSDARNSIRDSDNIACDTESRSDSENDFVPAMDKRDKQQNLDPLNPLAEIFIPGTSSYSSISGSGDRFYMFENEASSGNGNNTPSTVNTYHDLGVSQLDTISQNIDPSNRESVSEYVTTDRIGSDRSIHD